MKHRLKDVLSLLRELQKIDPEFPLQYAICLCEIARAEGLSLTILSQRTAMPLSTVSRIVGALAQNRQRGNPYGLVRVVLSASERRKKELYLTARGKAVIDDMAAVIEDAALAERQLRA